MRNILSLLTALVFSISITAQAATKDVKSKVSPKVTHAHLAANPIPALRSNPAEQGKYKRIDVAHDIRANRTPIVGTKSISSPWLAKITKTVRSVEIQNAVASFSKAQERRVKMLQDFIANSIGCYDSDGGVTAELKGKITFVMQALSTEAVKLSSAEDYCKTDRFLYEHDCSKYVQYPTGPRVLATQVACPDGSKCRDGACIQECKDSDGGIDPSVAGDVKIFLGGERKIFKDQCMNGFQISEGSCSILGGYVDNRFNCCTLGMICQDGRCVPPAVGGENLCGAANTDLCPEIAGYQPEYPYDRDGDGRMDSCSPFARDVCLEPDPLTDYPDATTYPHADGRHHLAVCWPFEGSKILHAICSADGRMSYDITECPDGLPCSHGKCDTCYDGDGSDSNPRVSFATAIDPRGLLSTQSDQCWGSAIREMYCTDGLIATHHIPCDPNFECDTTYVDGAPNLTVSHLIHL